MKKFLVITVVLALACLSSVAFAADVTVSGEVDFRSRLWENFDLNRTVNNETTSRSTMESRYLVSVNVKGDNNVKGKLSLWNDHDVWGVSNRTRTDSANNKGMSGNTSTVLIREAWIDFMVPDTSLGFTAGRRLIQLGNAWFFRSMYGGVGAYTAYYKAGDTTIAVQDAKFAEAGVSNAATHNTNSDDVDLYSVIGSTKLGGMNLAVDLSMLRDDSAGVLVAAGKGRLYNLGLHLNGKLGALALKAEIDAQQGMVDEPSGKSTRYFGNQVVLQASMPMDAITLNATVARGSGNKADDIPQGRMLSMLDNGQHYTLIYEYNIKTADGITKSGFANTTALSLGAMAKVTKNLEVGGDIRYLRATEQTQISPLGNPTAGAEKSYDVGTEIDLKANWKITKDLSWNWQLGYFMPGAAYKTPTYGKPDDAWGAQGILSLKF